MLIRARFELKFQLKRTLTQLEDTEQTVTSYREKKYRKFGPKIKYLGKKCAYPLNEISKYPKTSIM